MCQNMFGGVILHLASILKIHLWAVKLHITFNSKLHPNGVKSKLESIILHPLAI